MAATTNVFTLGEVTLAGALATAMQAGFFALLVVAGAATGTIKAKEPPPRREMPMLVKPVLDLDSPLLKLGSKKRAKLPDIWKKQKPIKRYKPTSAPTPMAEKTPEAIPTTEVAKGDAAPPPPDAEVAKEVDDTLPEAAPPDEEQASTEEGAADGVKEGTETDPLKARAVSQYLVKIIAWFNRRFRPPVGEVPCEELKQLSAATSVAVGPDRTVTGFTITRPSGNAAFDARVQAALEAAMGQELPPPPPLYPDIVGQAVSPVFSGKQAKCDSPTP